MIDSDESCPALPNAAWRAALAGGEAAGVWRNVLQPPVMDGELTAGHVLNLIMQDVVARRRAMLGDRVCWQPGVMSWGAGDAESMAVLRARYGALMDRLELAAPTDTIRFPGDPAGQEWIRYALRSLLEEGLLVHEHRVVGWCPQCETALSEAESVVEERTVRIHDIKLPVKRVGSGRSQFVRLAVRDLASLAAVKALAVHPLDDRYFDLVGETVVIPGLELEVPVVESTLADTDINDGVLALRPPCFQAHRDWAEAEGIDVEPLVDAATGLLRSPAAYRGMTLEALRTTLGNVLSGASSLVGVRDEDLEVPTCMQCAATLESRYRKEWFVDTRGLARTVLSALKDGDIRFTPDRWSKHLAESLEAEQSWCISRSWKKGGRLPLGVCSACGHRDVVEDTSASRCPSCDGAEWVPSTDRLDPWFMVWLWPLMVRSEQPEKEWPGPFDFLAADPATLHLWVGRSLMAGYFFAGSCPFELIHVHSSVWKESGEGEAPPVFPLMPGVSADVVRVALLQESDRRDCIELSGGLLDRARALESTVHRIAHSWSRHAPAAVPDPEWIHGMQVALPTDEQYLVVRIQREIREAEEALSKNRFAAYVDVVEGIFHEVLVPYVDYLNALRHVESAADVERASGVLGYAWTVALRLLHPLMPGLTERFWSACGAGAEGGTLMAAGWPAAVDAEGLAGWGVNDKAIAYVEAKHDLLDQARDLKHDYGLAPDQRAHLIIAPSSPKRVPWLREEKDLLVWQLHADPLEIDPEFTGAEGVPRALTKIGTLYLHIEGRVDTDEELGRLGKQLAKCKAELKKLSLKLDNIKFIEKAPEGVVEAERARRQEMVAEVEKLNKLMTTLKKRGGGI